MPVDPVNFDDLDILFHLLDIQTVEGRGGLAPSRDWLNGEDPEEAIAAAFYDALAGLAAAFGSPSPADWTLPRGEIEVAHVLASFPDPLVRALFASASLGKLPAANRATFGFNVAFGAGGIDAGYRLLYAQNRFSGFRLVSAPPYIIPLPAVAATSPQNQLPLATAWTYSDMSLLERP